MDINILNIRKKILVKYPMFGSILANTKFIESNEIKSCATDGEDIYYNLSFLSKLNDNEKIFAFAHEACHIAFDHIYRSEGRDKEVWDIATDAVINALLQQDGLPIVKNYINMPAAINCNAEQLYEKLFMAKQKKENGSQNKKQDQKNSENKNGCGGSNNNEQNSNNESDSNDQGNNDGSQETKNSENGSSAGNIIETSHDLWDKAIDKINKDSLNQNNEDSSKGNTIDEKEFFRVNNEQRKEQIEKMRKNLIDKMNYGRGSNESKLEIYNIGKATHLIDWRFLLKESIKYNIDWSYLNATIEDGVITPHLEEEPFSETEIVLDTSGSISSQLLINFLKECKNIIINSKIKVGCFDEKFYGFKEIKTDKDIDEMDFVGGGGTNFEAAINAFSKRVENKIIFTDGYAPMPNIEMNILWFVFGKNKINPIGGKVIYISEEHLKKLYDFK